MVCLTEQESIDMIRAAALLTAITALTAPQIGEEPMSFYKVNPKILAWLPAIHRVRDGMGLSSVKYSDALMLAFLHRETSPIGRADSHTPGKKYYTALQFYDGYLADALSYLKDPSLSKKAKDYNGKVDLTLKVFFAHMEKYRGTHQYQESMIAVVHKAGIGSAMEVRDLLNEGKVASVLEALEKYIHIPNDDEYFETWQKLFMMYAQWVHIENAKLHACSTEYLGEFGDDWPEIEGVIE